MFGHYDENRKAANHKFIYDSCTFEPQSGCFV